MLQDQHSAALSEQRFNGWRSMGAKRTKSKSSVILVATCECMDNCTWPLRDWFNAELVRKGFAKALRDYFSSSFKTIYMCDLESERAQTTRRSSW